jgi:phospholipid/cholesterol/gamma-HCH transport system ATP-binding protein
MAGSDAVLEFERVTVRFDETVALDSLDLRVERGDTWIVLGAAGSGKTVLLKCILGLTRPSAGRITLFGEEVTSMSERELFVTRSRAGMLFQEGALFDSLTVAENVAYPLRNQPVQHCQPGEIESRVRDALRFVELEHTLEKFPNELSGGMRRRVGIARATVTDPPLGIYDSPTAGLDPITANNIMAFIAKQRDIKRTTTIIVTYRYQDGMLMANYRFDDSRKSLVRIESENGGPRTRFLVLRDGKAVFRGSQAELEASTDEYVSKFGRR